MSLLYAWDLKASFLYYIFLQIKFNIFKKYSYFSIGVSLDMSPETVVISLATSLHLYSNSRALFGQNKQFQKNPTIYVQRDQPLIEVYIYIYYSFTSLLFYLNLQHITITDDHIRAQEEKVNELRRRIQQTMRSNMKMEV